MLVEGHFYESYCLPSYISGLCAKHALTHFNSTPLFYREKRTIARLALQHRERASIRWQLITYFELISTHFSKRYYSLQSKEQDDSPTIQLAAGEAVNATISAISSG